MGGMSRRYFTPAGIVIAFAGNSAPVGYLECDGAAVSRTTYAALFAVIGTIYGAGDTTTTFNLPDLRGEFIRGFDHGRGVDAGRALGSSQGDELESHTHRQWVDGYDYAGGSEGKAFAGNANFDYAAGGWSHATEATGGTETRPRNIALMYCIKV